MLNRNSALTYAKNRESKMPVALWWILYGIYRICQAVIAIPKTIKEICICISFLLIAGTAFGSFVMVIFILKSMM